MTIVLVKPSSSREMKKNIDICLRTVSAIGYKIVKIKK